MTFSRVAECHTKESDVSETTLTSVERLSKQSDEHLDKPYKNIYRDSDAAFEEILSVVQISMLAVPTSRGSFVAKFRE